MSNKSPSLTYLFIIFAKLGSVAFGGGMALVAQIEAVIVNRLGLLSADDMLDSIFVGTMFPGPIPTNVAVYVGTRLLGIQGALVCLIAVILPAFFLVLGMTILYFQSASLPAVDLLLMVIVPIASANIASMAINLTPKVVKGWFDLSLIVVSGCVLLSAKSVYTPTAIIVTTALLRWVKWKFFTKNTEETKAINKLNCEQKNQRNYVNFISSRNFVYWQIFFTLLICGVLAYCAPLPSVLSHFPYLKILITFAGIGVMLFGGAYVGIPLMEHVLVNQQHWISAKEFTVTLMLGQITPGPWTVSCAFIGYKIGNFAGATLAIVGLFLPSLILIVPSTKALNQLKSFPEIQTVLTGIRPVVVGMIYYAAWVIAKGVKIEWMFFVIFFITLAILQFARLKSLWFYLKGCNAKKIIP
jgi:chromate transporter